MDVREKLVELIADAGLGKTERYFLADYLIAHGVTITMPERARPLEEWSEDCCAVLWWKFPIEEPPYVGSPLDESWPAYHTHWTPISIPEPPKGE